MNMVARKTLGLSQEHWNVWTPHSQKWRRRDVLETFLQSQILPISPRGQGHIYPSCSPFTIVSPELAHCWEHPGCLIYNPWINGCWTRQNWRWTTEGGVRLAARSFAASCMMAPFTGIDPTCLEWTCLQMHEHMSGLQESGQHLRKLHRPAAGPQRPPAKAPRARGASLRTGQPVSPGERWQASQLSLAFLP